MENEELYRSLVIMLKMFKNRPYHLAKYLVENSALTEDFIKKLSLKLGREIQEEEIFINYDEGSKLFPNKSTWQNPESYPALRVDFFNPKLPCIFYNTKIKACTMYDIRPNTCVIYECDYLANNT